MVFLMEYECTAAFRSSPSSLFCVSCSYSASLEKKLGSGSSLPATETSFLSFANKTLAYPSCPISLSNHPLYLKKNSYLLHSYYTTLLNLNLLFFYQMWEVFLCKTKPRLSSYLPLSLSDPFQTWAFSSPLFHPWVDFPFPFLCYLSITLHYGLLGQLFATHPQPPPHKPHTLCPLLTVPQSVVVFKTIKTQKLLTIFMLHVHSLHLLLFLHPLNP